MYLNRSFLTAIFLQNEEKEKVTDIGESTEEMSSVCGHRQPKYDGDGSMVSYNQCGNLFHGPCVDNTRISSSQMNEKGVNWFFSEIFVAHLISIIFPYYINNR